MSPTFPHNNAGSQADGKTVFTSDEALDLAFVPEYVAIVGSGYIGLEFSDVYTALGAEVTFIEVSGVLSEVADCRRGHSAIFRPKSRQSRRSLLLCG